MVSKGKQKTAWFVCVDHRGQASVLSAEGVCTGKQIRFAKRTHATRYRSVLPLYSVHLSRRDALDAFVEQQERAIENAHETLSEAEELRAWARAQYEAGDD